MNNERMNIFFKFSSLIENFVLYFITGFLNLVISIRSEKSHMSLFTQVLRFFTSFRMTSACLLLFIFLNIKLSAQIELIPIQHPVYQFLSYNETKGFFQHFSMSSVPFQKNKFLDL